MCECIVCANGYGAGNTLDGTLSHQRVNVTSDVMQFEDLVNLRGAIPVPSDISSPFEGLKPVQQ